MEEPLLPRIFIFLRLRCGDRVLVKTRIRELRALGGLLADLLRAVTTTAHAAAAAAVAVHPFQLISFIFFSLCIIVLFIIYVILVGIDLCTIRPFFYDTFSSHVWGVSFWSRRHVLTM